MFGIDHLAVWTTQRDEALEVLAEATGLSVLDGFAPGGRRVARGVRFANGPFVDLHQAEADGAVLLGLGGDVQAAETLAKRQGWRARITHRGVGPDAEPWSLAAFGRGQGLMSRIFVIDYAGEPAAWASPVFNGGLYHRPAAGGPSLERVWVAAADSDRAAADLRALGFRAGAEVASCVSSASGRLYRGRPADIVLCAGEDAIIRVDVTCDGPAREIDLGAGLKAVLGPEFAEEHNRV